MLELRKEIIKKQKELDGLKCKWKLEEKRIPSEMSVIFVSMRRCGISMIIRALSDHHEAIFGTPIDYGPENAEISYVKARGDRFPLHKRWNCVYNVDPKDLLNKIDPDGKQYDRVIRISRERDLMKLIHEVGYVQNSFIEEMKVKFRRTDEMNYHKVYDKEFDDPRFISLDLEEFNNKTKINLNKLMDFLNFPKEGRAPVLPIPVYRSSEGYSSLILPNEVLCKPLKDNVSLFELNRNGFLQLMTNKKKERLKKIELKRIVVTGPGILRGCHFSENIYYALKKKGYEAEFIGVDKLNSESYYKEYRAKEMVCPLSKLVNKASEKPDLIIADEPAIKYYNDLDIPVFYYQREFKRPPMIYYPDIAVFWHDEILKFFKKQFAPVWAAKVGRLKSMHIAINPKYWVLAEKIYHGVTGIAGREVIRELPKRKELIAAGHLRLSIEDYETYEKYGMEFLMDEHGGVTDERFRELLPQCEAIWCFIPEQQYVSRRIIEAMACKTLAVFRIQDDTHLAILSAMGFENKKHYIGLKSKADVVEFNKNWDLKRYQPIINRAYDAVLKNHTFENRVDFIVDWYKDYMAKKVYPIR